MPPPDRPPRTPLAFRPPRPAHRTAPCDRRGGLPSSQRRCRSRPSRWSAPDATCSPPRRPARARPRPSRCPSSSGSWPPRTPASPPPATRCGHWSCCRRGSWRCRSRRASAPTAGTCPCCAAPPSTAAWTWSPQTQRPARRASRSSWPRPGRLLDHVGQRNVQPRPGRDPRARRGRPDARHGLPARHPAHPRAASRQAARTSSSPPPSPMRSAASPRSLLHDPATVEVAPRNTAAEIGPPARHPRRPRPQGRAARASRAPLRPAPGARLHAHQDRRATPGVVARPAGHRRRGHPQ